MDVTGILAIYGAGLSTIIAIAGAISGRARFTVTMSMGHQGDDETLEFGAFISVRNKSTKTIHLSGIDLLYQHGSSGAWAKAKHIVRHRNSPRTVGWVHMGLNRVGLSDDCPARIEPGQGHDVFVPESALAKTVAKATGPCLRAKAQDQVWRTKISPKLYPMFPKDGAEMPRV